MVVSTATFGRGSRDLTIHLQLKMHQADKQDQIAAFGFKTNDGVEAPFLNVHKVTLGNDNDNQLLYRCIVCAFLFLSHMEITKLPSPLRNRVTEFKLK